MLCIQLLNDQAKIDHNINHKNNNFDLKNVTLFQSLSESSF